MRRILALLLLSAACAGDLPPPPPSTASAVLAPRPEILAAGTGALTPLAMALAREVWTGTGLRIRVEPSIGSGGGISATRDGAVDLGLVSASGAEGPEPGRLTFGALEGLVALMQETPAEAQPWGSHRISPKRLNRDS